MNVPVPQTCQYLLHVTLLHVCVREALEHLIPRVPMTTSTVDRAALFNLFSHVKETLLCLRASNGEISSNKAFGQARMKLAKEIKAHIEYKSGEETFNVANLNCGEFKGAVASLNVAELRKTLTDHGVLGKASEKRARAVHVLEVEAVGTPVHAGRAKKKQPSANQ